jgi:colicin import membrane protein
MNAQTNKIESVTLDTTATLHNFLLALDAADVAEVARFNNTENAIQLLKPLRAQYSTLQDGRSKGKKPAAGELPAVIYFSVIESIYNEKKLIAEQAKLDFNLKYESYRDFQVRSLKYYIETGDLLNNKKSTLQERVMVAIDKLEKKLKVEQAKAEKLRLEKEKADAKKAKADADAIKAKADAEQTIDEVHNIMDENPQGADAIKDDLFDIIETAEKSIVDADADAIKAKADAEKADAIKAKADADVSITTEKLTKAKDKLANLSAGKADNKKTEPSLDFKVLNFSQDCKDTAAMILEELERGATSAAELLYLAKLILDKYNK